MRRESAGPQAPNYTEDHHLQKADQEGAQERERGKLDLVFGHEGKLDLVFGHEGKATAQMKTAQQGRCHETTQSTTARKKTQRGCQVRRIMHHHRHRLAKALPNAQEKLLAGLPRTCWTTSDSRSEMERAESSSH